MYIYIYIYKYIIRGSSKKTTLCNSARTAFQLKCVVAFRVRYRNGPRQQHLVDIASNISPRRLVFAATCAGCGFDLFHDTKAPASRVSSPKQDESRPQQIKIPWFITHLAELELVLVRHQARARRVSGWQRQTEVRVDLAHLGLAPSTARRLGPCGRFVRVHLRHVLERARRRIQHGGYQPAGERCLDMPLQSR